MTDILASSPIDLIETGLPGESVADVARRTGAGGALPSDNDEAVLKKLAGAAIAAGTDAQPGEYLVRGAGNDPIFLGSSGTGADAGLRSDLAAANGSANVGFKHTGTGAEARSVQVVLQDQAINPKDFGAIGDGDLHTLASLGYSLAQAQARWGSEIVTSTSQSIESVAINAALKAAAFGARRVVLPDGRYCLGESLKIPSFVTFEGQSREGTVLYNQNFPLAAPAMVNADPNAFLFVTIRNITVLGATMVLRVNVALETAGCTIENITANLQTQKSMEWSSCQTTVIRNCEFKGARDYGIDFLGYPANAVTLDHVRIGEARRYPLRLRGYDLFTICNSSSIEQGAVPPRTATVQFAGTTMNVTELAGGGVEKGMLVVGPGIVSGTRIVATAADNSAYTGGGGGGTYGVSIAQTTAGISGVALSFASIDAEAGPSEVANMLVIRDSYFEGGHKILLHNSTVVGTPSGTMLDGNKITNSIDGLGVLFSGNATITFGTNYWGQSTPGPALATIIGQNKGMTLDRAWTPTISSLTGALGSVTVSEASYRDLGGGVRSVTLEFTITDNGTGATGIKVTLPSAARRGTITGKENATTGFGITGEVSEGSNELRIAKDDATYPGGTGNRLLLNGTYRTQ